MRDIIVVVPCYNEGKRLRPDAFCRALQEQDALQLIFVNDGSTDSTQEILERLRDEFPARVELLSLYPNSGKAEAVRIGLRRAIERRPDLVGFWDADLATPLSDIRVFQDLLQSNQELLAVIGARVQLLGRHVERRALRHYLGRVFATAASALLDLRVYDTQCGAKLFRNCDEVARLFDSPFVARWSFDVEILARLVRDRRRAGRDDTKHLVYEHPLERWTDIAGSKVRARDFFRAFVELWRIGRTTGLLPRRPVSSHG